MSELQLTRTECGLPDSVGLCSLSQEKLPGQPELRILGHFHICYGLRRSATSWSLGTSRCPLTGRCPLTSQSQPLPLSTLEKMNTVKPKHRTHVYDVWIGSRKACRALEASASSERSLWVTTRHPFVMSTLGKGRRKDQELKANLSYIASSRPLWEYMSPSRKTNRVVHTAQGAKVLSAKPNNVSLIPGTPWWRQRLADAPTQVPGQGPHLCLAASVFLKRGLLGSEW